LFDLFEESVDKFGFNLGGGAFGFVSERVGFRGDIRWYQSLAGGTFEVPDVVNFDYWRGTVGVTFRW